VDSLENLENQNWDSRKTIRVDRVKANQTTEPVMWEWFSSEWSLSKIQFYVCFACASW